MSVCVGCVCVCTCTYISAQQSFIGLGLGLGDGWTDQRHLPNQLCPGRTPAVTHVLVMQHIL